MSIEQPMKKDLILTINGTKFRAKNLDANFLKFVEDTLEEVEVTTNKDNTIQSLFFAYLTLAKKQYIFEQELEELTKGIEL